jgi:deoxyadenosine/deoxycytidine kinase
MRRYALPTQLFFLFQRVAQLEALKQPDLFASPWWRTSASPAIRSFARLTLDDAEYQLYAKIYEHVKPQAPVPTW